MANLLLDTNVLHYAGGSSPEIDVDRFWKEALDGNEHHFLFISDETQRELQIQFVNCAPKLKRRIETMVLPKVEVLAYSGSIEREHKLRHLAAFVKKKYKLRVPDSGKEMVYPSTSDARIILTALDNDCIVVTRNVKDFLVYLCFGQTIWDPVTNKKINLEQEMWEQMKEDEELQQLVEACMES